MSDPVSETAEVAHDCRVTMTQGPAQPPDLCGQTLTSNARGLCKAFSQHTSFVIATNLSIICSKIREMSLALLFHLGYNSELFVFLRSFVRWFLNSSNISESVCLGYSAY